MPRSASRWGTGHRQRIEMSAATAARASHWISERHQEVQIRLGSEGPATSPPCTITSVLQAAATQWADRLALQAVNGRQYTWDEYHAQVRVGGG